jgi:hypothetical protein
MAVTTQEIEMLGCDVEDCEIKAPAIGGKIPAKFHAGTTTPEHLDDEPVTWVACRETHIGKAVIAVKAKALAERAPAPEAAEDVAEQPADSEPQRHDDEDPEERRRHEEADLEALDA